MFKIVGTLPVKTRLPLVAWVLAGLVTLFSLVTSLTQVSGPMVRQLSRQRLTMPLRLTYSIYSGHSDALSFEPDRRQSAMVSPRFVWSPGLSFI